ncbi:MAG: tRNA (guanosine(37)-N1)-methyltransferase TrmD [Candidatus Yanofskybacteria bacterium]|nr:tRNA (guanosine(37)-N1)-methyltransferase TrmD [Candidatus Yanofskybacteria bacterium]
MRFDIITIFPELFDAFAKESLLKKAQGKKLLEIHAHNLRDWAQDAHKTVDDKPFGGGLGMVMQIEPIWKAVSDLKRGKSRTILFSPRGKKFTQQKAFELAKHEQLIMICGRYEGVDERVHKYVADEVLSLGNFVLMGGEIPAMAVVETVSRLVPGVVGKDEFLCEHVVDTDTGNGFIEYPQYTRPEVFEPKQGVRWKAPQVLLSGNHKEIGEWRKKHRKVIGK